MLFKLNNNFYQLKKDKFLSYGKTAKLYLIGSWFNCSSEESTRLCNAVIMGEIEIVHKLPGSLRRY